MPASGLSDWLQAPVIGGLIGATIGAIPGFCALIYARRIDKRQQAEDQPKIIFKLQPSKNAGWYDLTIHLRNRTDAAWLFERVEFPGATDLRAARGENLKQKTRSGGYEDVPPSDQNTAPGPIAIGAELSPHGTPGLFGSYRDERYEHVLFRCSSRRKRVSIRVVLSSMESDARRMVVTAKRDIPMLIA